MPVYEEILFKNMKQPGYSGSLADYQKQGGYQPLRKVLKEMTPEQMIELVKKSGLRGRGGTISCNFLAIARVDTPPPQVCRK